jgi:hypothetical protein
MDDKEYISYPEGSLGFLIAQERARRVLLLNEAVNKLQKTINLLTDCKRREENIALDLQAPCDLEDNIVAGHLRCANLNGNDEISEDYIIKIFPQDKITLKSSRWSQEFNNIDEFHTVLQAAELKRAMGKMEPLPPFCL